MSVIESGLISTVWGDVPEPRLVSFRKYDALSVIRRVEPASLSTRDYYFSTLTFTIDQYDELNFLAGAHISLTVKLWVPRSFFDGLSGKPLAPDVRHKILSEALSLGAPEIFELTYKTKRPDDVTPQPASD